MQKLGKVQLGLQEEQRLRDTSKEKYTAAAAEQRKCYTVLRAFQVSAKEETSAYTEKSFPTRLLRVIDLYGAKFLNRRKNVLRMTGWGVKYLL